jgi:hypothetical protein
MFKKGKIIFTKIKGDLYPTLDMLDSEPSISRDLEEENYYPNKKMNDSTNFYRTKTQMSQPKSKVLLEQYAEIQRKNALNQDKQNTKIVRKEIMFSNNQSDQNKQNSSFQSSTKKPMKMQNILSDANKTNNSSINDKVNDGKIDRKRNNDENESLNEKNNLNLNANINQTNLIPKPNNKNMLLRKNNFGNKKLDININLRNQNKVIKKQQEEKHEIDYLQQANEYFAQKGLTLEQRIDFEYYTIKIQAYFRGYITRKKLYSLINNCIKINNGINLIQKIFSNKIDNVFKIIKKSNNNKNLNSNVLRSKHPNYQLYIQNKLKEIENHFKYTDIDRINRIIINIPKKAIMDYTNLLYKKKYILKYLFIKKQTKLSQILKYYLEKYKKNALNIIKSEEITNAKSDNINDEELKIKKIKDLVRKKIYKTKEIMHRAFTKYYYRALYIHINWYMYVVNQLSYSQNLANNPAYSGNYNYYSNINSGTISSTDDTYKKQPSSDLDNALRESIRTINKINDSKNPNDALRESIMCINKITDELSKETEIKKKAERNKHLKDLFDKKVKERKNELHRLFTKFYYQGILVAKEKSQKANNSTCEVDENSISIQLDNEKGKTVLRGKRKEKVNPAEDRRNKARNLRKLMLKKEKEKLEKLRLYFYKFHTNGMLFHLKRNAKKSFSCKNVIINIEEIQNKLAENNNEITLLDKKLMEEELEKNKLNQKKISALKNIFYKTDRQYMVIKKKTFEKWNLRAKILSLALLPHNISKNKIKKKKIKKKKEIKESQENKEKKEEEEQKNEQ